MKEVFITDHHIISSLGFDSETNFENLKNGISGIKKHLDQNGKSYYGSLIDKEELNNKFSKIGNKKLYTTLEKLMILSVENLLALSANNISNKTGLIISTTKGNIDVLNSKSDFYYANKRAYLSELGQQISGFFEFKNEAIVLSNACVSGVLALSVAQRLIQSEMYDDVVVISGDLVSEFVLSGFNSFQAISDKPCKPFSKNRTGITIGEAVVSAFVSSSSNTDSAKYAIKILGSGSSNDANHISGPSRTGEGLFLSVKSALKEANVSSREIDYISAHGTATEFNDEMEAIAFDRLDMLEIPLNSLKGYYGHTLGASGMLETIIGMESMQQNVLIPTKGFDDLGVSKNVNIIKKMENRNLDIILKTASGFGGCNTALILKKIIN